MKTRNSFAAWPGVVVVLALGTACGRGAGGGGDTSTAAVAITVQPADQRVLAGTPATFEVVATHASGYQWQRSTDGGTTFAGVAGATGTSYTTPAAALADDGTRYRVVVSNAAGSVTSAAASLTVTPAGAVSITTTSPLPTGTVNAAYGVTLAASGGTPPYTWSVADGSTLPAFLTLSASTGEISGTLPDVEAVYALNLRVADSANPPSTDERTLELFAVRPCDHGLGFLTADNAPASVGGKFCPTTVGSRLVPNELGLVAVWWTETHDYGGGAYFESVLVEFYPVTGAISILTYHLSDPTHLVDYDCTLTGDAYRRACSGVSLDPATGELFLLNTDVGLTPAFTLRLNGLLFYTP